MAFYFPSLWCDVMSFYWGVGDLVETLLLLFLINDNFHYHSRNETETKWNQNRRWKRIFELNTYLTTYMKNNKNIPPSIKRRHEWLPFYPSILWFCFFFLFKIESFNFWISSKLALNLCTNPNSFIENIVHH